MNRLAAIPLPMALLAPAALKAEVKSATPAVPASSAGAPDTSKNVDDPFLFAQLIQEIAAASTPPAATVKTAVPAMPVRLAPPAPSAAATALKAPVKNSAQAAPPSRVSPAVPENVDDPFLFAQLIRPTAAAPPLATVKAAVPLPVPPAPSAPSAPATTAIPEAQVPVRVGINIHASRAIAEYKATEKTPKLRAESPAPAVVEIPVPAPPAPVKLKPSEFGRNAVGGNAATPNAVSEPTPEQAPHPLERMIDTALELRIRPQQEPAPAPIVSAPPAAQPPFEMPVAHEPVPEEAGRAATAAPVRASTTSPAATRPLLSDAPAVTYYARQVTTAPASPVISNTAPVQRTEPRPTPPAASPAIPETPDSAAPDGATPAPSGPATNRESPVEPPPVPNIPVLRPPEPAHPHAEVAYVPDLAAPITVAPVPASAANAEIGVPQPALSALVTPPPVPPGSPAPLEEPVPAEPAPSPPLRSLSLEFAPDGAGDVRLRLSERAGEVHVSLHSSDSSLAGRLHEGVHDLVGSLSRAGYDAEAWTPDQGRQNNPRQPDTPRRTRSEGSSASSAEDFAGMLQQPVQEVS